MEYVPTNREKRRAKHDTLVWCFACDATQTSEGIKCKVCGYVRNGKRRFKAGKDGGITLYTRGQME